MTIHIDQVELVALPMRSSFKLADVEVRLSDVSDSTITKVLGALRKSGRLRLEGRGRGAVWHTNILDA